SPSRRRSSRSRSRTLTPDGQDRRTHRRDRNGHRPPGSQRNRGEEGNDNDDGDDGEEQVHVDRLPKLLESLADSDRERGYVHFHLYSHICLFHWMLQKG